MSFKSVAEFLALTGPDAPTQAERSLIEATRAGEPCILGMTVPAAPSAETRIRARLLRLLILGGTQACGLTERGVVLVGGWIDGKLDLAFCSARGLTVLRSCKFSDTPDVAYADLQYLGLDGSHLPALGAQGLKVKGSLFFRNLIATGTVSVIGAKIGMQLVCTGASFDGNGSRALNARRVEVGQSFFLDNLTANGTIDVSGAKIGGQLVCTGASFDGNGSRALNARRLDVTGSFLFRRLKTTLGTIDLTDAHVGDLVDDPASWPTGEDQLILDGFTYGRIHGPVNFADRSNWLKNGSYFGGNSIPQPYTQFARVLRQMGYAGEARKVLMSGANLQAAAVRERNRIVPNGDVSVAFLSLEADIINLVDFLQSFIAIRILGFRYTPIRSSVYTAAILVLIADTFAYRAWVEGSFAPNSDVILMSPGWAEVTANDCFPTVIEGCDENPAKEWADTFTANADIPTQGADWDSFNSIGYAVDLVVPVLDLGQTDSWAPSKDRGPWGWWLWWMRWVLAAAGWVVTGLGVAAVTGVMQRNQPD